ncbi:uncharacterized protein SOCEGT47_029740 [Sorangium cellulosum]|uniref:PEGA domain-containing protein n=1 Tax=Sorangium cellulosum TaxID=56 RepID=A0A4P2Q0B5_SORCE|nr:hypothetical protein [Sorangium cellulosum]AUX22471.1 uncharacterized protein SOCEGT47_029740 [Sorangium cellulosum]
MTTIRERPTQVVLPMAKRLLSIALVALCAAPGRAQATSSASPPASLELAESSSPATPPAPLELAESSSPATPPAPLELAESSSPALPPASLELAESSLSSSPARLPASPAGAGSSSPPPPPPPPWHQGVSEERKQRAQALFTEARELHRGMMLAEARTKYEEALAAWEHPELRLYLGRVLKSIGLPLLAYENLRLSLRWGPGSLDPERELEARAALRALVTQDLAAIEIRCDEPGAAVRIDGKPWFVGPGTARRMVTPGEHVVMARKDGYFTVVEPLLVLAGKEASGQLALSVDTLIVQRRWPAWIPWATLGAGAALGLVGGGLMWHARAEHGGTNDEYGDRCGQSCTMFPDDPLRRPARAQRHRERCGDRRPHRRRSDGARGDGPALPEQATILPHRGSGRPEDRDPARRVARHREPVGQDRVLIRNHWRHG